MERYKKRNTILVVISAFILVVLALLISKVTYSFLEPIDPDDVRIEGEVTATGDTLLFSKGTDIEVILNQDNFGSSSGNLVRSVTPQVQLIASNKTNNATANYYVTVNIKENTFKYTNGTSNPEILLTVTDNDGNPLTTCTGLTYTTVGGVSGFDITDKMGVYDFPVQTISTTSSTTGTTKNWTYTVTFINKTTDQSINEDAKIDIEAILHKEPETFCELNPDNGGCRLTLSYNPAVSKNVTLENGYIYYHDDTLENGAGDYSYRYAGANPNNYICFGSDASTCPADNLYRIIGLIPVDVVTDETDPQNPVIEKQMIYKLIKNDYETSTSLGMTANSSAVTKASSYAGPAGNQPSGDVEGFYWKGTAATYNTWSLSTLNTTGLNTNAYGTFSSAWQNKIAKVIWKVGGNTFDNIGTSTPMSIVYGNEITNPVTTNTQDNKTEYAAKIGLMYVSDYGYAAPLTAWTTATSSYSSSTIRANNWLYKGSWEWTISRCADGLGNVLCFGDAGSLYSRSVNHANGVRRVFYLTQNTTIDTTNHAGTLADPYRIKMDYVYWNDNFSNTTYTSSQLPTGSGLNGTYETRELLATAYSNWSNAPVYIKTIRVNGTVTGHEACIWYNSHEFCIAPNYWDTDFTTTKVKLQAAMEAALGTQADNCSTYVLSTYCYFGDWGCGANQNGYVECAAGNGGCKVNGDGSSNCRPW